MITVDLPDGRKVEFPDDMPREEIKARLQRNGLIPPDLGSTPGQSTADWQIVQPQPSRPDPPGFIEETLNPNPTTQYGTLLPFAKDQGANKVDWGRPPQMLQEVASMGKNALTIADRARRGEASFEEMMQGAQDTVGFIGTGTLARGLAPTAARSTAAAAQAAGEAMAVPAIAETVQTAVMKTLNPLIERLPNNADQAAARRLVTRLEQDGLTVNEIGKELQRLGPQGTLADAGGRNIQNQTRRLIQEPGKTAQRAEEFLDQRQATQASRVVNSVRNNISAKNYYGDMDRLTEQQRGRAGPLYQRAYEKYQNVTSGWLRNAMDQEPLIQRGLARGSDQLRTEATIDGVKYNPRKYGIVDFNSAGDPIVGKETPLSMWHAARKGLDEMIEDFRDPLTGKTSNGARQLENLRRRLNEEIKEVTGGNNGLFGKADSIYSEPAKLKDAMWMGRNFAKGDEEITAKLFNSLSEAEKAAYRIGVSRELVAMVRKTGTTPARLKNILKDTEISDKIKIIAPTPEQYDRFISNLKREARFSETNALRGGSQTGLLNAEGADMGADFVGAALANVAQGRTASGLAGGVVGALKWLQKNSMPQSVKDRMGRMLLSNDPAEQRKALDMMRKIEDLKARPLPLTGANQSARITGGRNQAP